MNRLGKRVLPFLILVTPLLVYGALFVDSSSSDVSKWLPKGRLERQKYDQFLERFGDDQSLVVSWPGCTFDDPRQHQFAAALRKRIGEDSPGTECQIETTLDAVNKLTAAPVSLKRRTAVRRLRGVVVGPHGGGVVVLKFSRLEKQHQSTLIDLVIKTAQESIGLDRQSLRIGGSVYEAVAIDETSYRSLIDYIIPSSFAALVVAYLCMRSLRTTFIVFVIAGYCQVLAVALVSFLGGKFTAVLLVLPTLIFMLTLSASVHLVNYYRDAGGDSAVDSGDKAIRFGWLPCILASWTTVIGLSSLLVSDLQPVRDFGFYAAISLFLSTAVLLISFAPLISRRIPVSLVQTRAANTRRFAPAAEYILNHAGKISLVVILAVVGIGFGTTRLTSSAGLRDMFAGNTRIVRDFEWIEQNIGPLISVEVILSFPSESNLDILNRLELISDVHRAVRAVPEVGGIVSPRTFIPPIPNGTSGLDYIQRSLFREKLEKNRNFFEQESLLSGDVNAEHWRITARIAAIGRFELGELTEKVRAAARSVIRDHPQIDLTITGLAPVLKEAENLILADLTSSFLLALLLIYFVTIFIVGGIVPACLVMIPNVAPIALVFGGMGWFGTPVDIASVLTASVALGIAVDDTFHFVTWFKRGSRRRLSNRAAVAFAYQKCAPAMIQTTLICCVAMLVFLPTEFLPTRKFAVLMTLLLVSALIGDLILLPAILAGPLGVFFPGEQN